MSILRIELLYGLAGLMLAHLAVSVARDRQHPRRCGATMFWGLLAVLFIAGQWLPSLLTGYLVLALVGLAAGGQVLPSREASRPKEERLADALRFRNRLFMVALLIPVTAVAGSLGLARIRGGTWWLIEPKHATLISLGLGAVVALAAGVRVTGARLREPCDDGGRLLQVIGWPLILPQLLAALGGIFAKAGVGEAVSGLVTRALPTHIPMVAVAAYAVGMMLFTVCMGNAFAAFPVITLGIGLPLIVHEHGGNPAIMAAIGMLSGYCGTLMTPMAANFNIVPAMLLELKDPHAVIRAQIPIGLALLALNIVLMQVLVFRF